MVESFLVWKRADQLEVGVPAFLRKKLFRPGDRVDVDVDKDERGFFLKVRPVGR